jgi:gliding motility-associated-like protein
LNTLDITSLGSGSYELIVTDASGCTASENVTVSGNAAPVINDAGLTLVQPTCILNGSISGLGVTGSNPFTYAWTNTSQTTLNITNLTAGDYSLTVTDNNGCTTSYGPVTLTAPAGAVASFIWSPLEPNEGETVTFTNTSSGAGAIISTWTIQGGTQNSTDATTIFSTEGDYVIVLSIVDANGCVDIIEQTITIFGTLAIPNVISANGDGVNDVFEMQGLKAYTELIIIDRWGIVVFKTDDYKNDWGGKDQSGNDLSDGVYTYSYKTTDGKQGHGFVHLIR